MREILFSKYSMERSPQFAIRTSIVRDERRRWVEKLPMTQDAVAHVEKLASSYDALCRVYEGTRVRPCPVVMESGIAKFDFLEGEFFHEKLGQLIAEKNEEGILAFCEEFVSIVRSGAGVEKFRKTPEFVRVFGDVELPDGLTAMPFSNVDWVFENLIEEENGDIALIDYEWCFDFPVPLEYVLYRSLYITFMRWGRTAFVDQTLCRRMGISPDLISALWQMEAGFTHYVAQGDCSDKAWHEYMPTLQRSYDWRGEIERNRRELIVLRQQLIQAQYDYSVISNAFFWKITKPARAITDAIKSLLKRNYYTWLLCKGLKCWKQNGFSYTWQKIRDKRLNRQGYSRALKVFSPQELKRQRKKDFPKKIKFSILVPLYNTPKRFLKEMIQSVLNQTYGNWELCLADGSDDQHGEVEKICRKYAKKDFRIQYKRLEDNLGISENTNACIEMSSGDYIALLDHDDLIHPAALHEVMKAICEKDADFVYTDEAIFHNKVSDSFDFHLKSDYAPDTLRSINYICHLTVFKKELLERTEGFRKECDGSQDFDLILRLTEKAKQIAHVPLILYYWRSHSESTADSIGTKPYAIKGGHRALKDHLQRMGLEGEVLDTVIPTMYRIRYKITGNPKISIIIPNQDHKDDLRTCLDSIYSVSMYSNFEVVIIENGSKTQEIFAYYEEIEEKWSNVHVISWKGTFNYAAINNFGVRHAHGEHILLLNNDTRVITPEWMEEMLMFSQRSDVGAVGAKLYYSDDTIQHAGIIIGIGSTAGHQHKGADREDYGYLGRLVYAQNLSAVTGACMMIRRSVWNEVGGLDEKFVVAFNDVDICLRIRKAGYLVVWTPYAELYHYESKSRGYEDTPEKQARFQRETQLLQSRWAKELKSGDPYYNPNLTLDREDLTLK